MAIRKQEENIDTVNVRESMRMSIKIDEPNLLGETLWKQGINFHYYEFILMSCVSFEIKVIFSPQVH